MKKFFIALFFQAFLLNFVWEVTQMPLYLSGGMGERENYPRFLGIHWQVSLFDALTILAAYLLVALIMRNIRWGVLGNKSVWTLFISGLFVWQIIVEYIAVYVYHRWAYASAMPLIFGIGLLPLLQMVTLGPLTIFLTYHFLKVEKN